MTSTHGNVHRGSQPEGPDEGFYDARRGATAYAPIVGAFGALAVTAIVVVFTTTNGHAPVPYVIFATGLLAIGVFSSILGAIGLAAIGAERHPTSNLAPAIMFIATPVCISITSILGAFGVLARIYVDQADRLFVFITGAGGIFSVLLTAYVIGDSTALHPRTLNHVDFDLWWQTQWLKNRRQAYSATNKIMLAAIVAPLCGLAVRMSGVKFNVTQTEAEWVIYLAIAMSFAGVLLSMNRTKHPALGNNQVGLRRWEAWATTLAIGAYTAVLLLFIP